MKLLLLLQVMLCLCTASIVAQPAEQNVAGLNEIDARTVWDIRGKSEVWDKMRECERDDGYLGCISEIMRQGGASSQAIAVSRLLEGDVFISSFREMGKVDLAEAFNPFMANSNDRLLLVNGTPHILDVGSSLNLNDNVLRRDTLYPSFRRRYPDLAIGGYPAFEEMQALKTGEQRFVFRFQLVNGCQACWANSYASIAYDFDRTGRFRGNTFIQIIRARADGTPIPTPSAQTRGRSRKQSAAAPASSRTAAVASDFLSQLDNAKARALTLGKLTVVDGYALQNWSTEHMGGQALLRFSPSTGTWVLVNMGGGAWDADSLVSVGVPRAVAALLVKRSL